MMSHGSTGDESKRFADFLLIAAFFALLSYPALALFENPEELQARFAYEKRALGRKPALWDLATAPSKFAAEFKSFFDDQFESRGRLVALNSAIRYELFNVSSSGKVLPGKHGALFYAGEPVVPRYDFGHEAAQFRRVLPVTRRRLDRLRAILESRRKWAHDMGAEFLFVIAPDKSSSYPEQMPEWMNRLDGPTFTDLLVAHLKATSVVDVVDLRPAIRRAKESGRPLYYLHDTHWNHEGAFVGYGAITERLRRSRPAIPLLGPDDVVRSRDPEPYQGDLARMLHLEAELAEDSTRLLLKTPRARPIPFPLDATPVATWSKPPQAFRIDDPRLPKALVYHDSFMKSMTPYLAENFETSIFIPDYRVVASTVRGYKPDVVIFECIERSLYYIAYQTDDLLPTIEPAMLAETYVDPPTRTR